MTAQLEAPRVVAASGPVLMTADEARRVIDGIREGLENVRTLLLDLHEREGWRVLGYESFVACAEAEFSASKSQAYRLLDAARLDAILSPIGENGLPEAHLRELKVVADEPEVARSIVSHVRALKGESMTAGDLRDGVDEYVARPPRAKAAKPAVPVRRSVTSRAEAGDFADDAPDYVQQSQEAGDDLAAHTNNERYGRVPSRLASHFCSLCGPDSDHQTEVCPYAPTTEKAATTDAPADPAAALVSEDALGTGADGAPGHQGEASGEGDHLTDAASTTDQSGAAGPSAEADTPADPSPAPPAAPSRPIESAPRTVGVSLGNRPTPAPSRPIGERKLDAGDLTRALFDFPASTVVEAMGEALSVQERGSLAAQLIDALPTAEVERLAHRVAVRTRAGAGGDLSRLIADRPVAEIAEAVPEPKVKELIAALTDRILAGAI